MAKNNNDITLLIGAEFDKDVRSSLQKELENMGLSTEVSAKLADDARADLLKEIRAITSENKKLAPIDVKARINERSKRTINQYLKRLKERDVEINLELAEKSVAELEKRFDSFGAKIAKKISDELSKSLNIKFDTGGLGLKEANAGIKRIAEMRASLQKLKGELSQIGSGKYASEAVYNAALAQVSNIDTALASGDIDKMGLALGEATESARALRREIGEIENAIKKIGKRDLGNELKELLGHKDATASAKSELQEAYNRIMEGFDTKDANGQIAAIKELDKAFSEYAATLKKVAEVRTEAGKDSKSLDKVLGGKSMFSGSAQPSELVAKYDMLAKRAAAAQKSLEGVKKSGEGYEAVHARVAKIVSKFEELCAKVDEYKAKTKGDALTLRKEKLSSQIDTLIGSHPKVAKDNTLVTQLRQIQAEIAKADGATLSNLENEFRNLNRTATQTGLKVESFGNKVSNMFKKFTGWFSVSQIVMQTVNYVKQFGQELVEVDTYLTEISKTSNKTAAELSKLGNASGDAAKKYGAAITGYLEGIQEMSRAGYNDKGQAEAMASLSILAQSAGAVTAEVANQFLIATDASYQFKGNINELTKVLDGANGITNKYAVNLTDIASGMSIAGASASQFNVQVDELAAAIGTMNAVTQLGGETSARAFRYLMGVLSKTTGDYDGEIVDTESLSKAEKALGAIGVKMAEVRDGVTHLRNPMQVLKEVATALQGLESTDARKADVLNALGGTNRQASVAALLNNFTMYEQMLSTYASSVGSAEAEALKTAESIQGRLNNIATTIVQIFDNLANSNTIRNTLSVFEGLLTLLEKVTGATSGLSDVGTLFATIGNALSLFYNIGFDGNKIWAGIKDFADGKDFDIKGGLKSKGQAIAEFTKELWSGKSRIEAYDQAIKDLSASGKEFFEINKETGNAIITNPEKMREAAGGLSAMQLQILDVVDKSGNAGVSMDALGKKFKNVGIKAKLGAVGTKVLGMALTSLASFAIGAAIDLIVSGIQYVAQSAERAAEAANAARESIEKTASAVEAAGKKVDGAKKKYEELGEAYDELRKKADRVGGWDNLSTEDYDRYVELSGEIIELFPNVDSAFDSNYNHIVTLTDGVKGLNGEYEKLLEQQRQEIANSGQAIWKDFIANDTSTLKNANIVQSFYDDYIKFLNNEMMLDDFSARWKNYNPETGSYYIEKLFKQYGYSGKDYSGIFQYFLNEDRVFSNKGMVDSVYKAYMSSSALSEVNTTASDVKESIIARLETNDYDSGRLGEAGVDLIRAYLNGMSAFDLAQIDERNINGVKDEILKRLFGSMSDAEIQSISSIWGGLQESASQFAAGNITRDDYFVQYTKARNALVNAYGNEESADALLGVDPLMSQIDKMYDLIMQEFGYLDAHSYAEFEIVYNFAYDGKKFESIADMKDAINEELQLAAEEATSSPLNYDNYINGYEQTSAANDRLIERIESQMGQATNITERNQIADRLVSIYDEELLNLEGLVEALDADLANYDLSDEIKDAIAGGDSSLVDLGDVNKDLVNSYETVWDMRQSALDRIATITSKRDATASGKADAVREFYDKEIAWRQMAVDAQNDYLDDLKQTEGEARQERYGNISTLYGAMKDEAQKSYDILSEYYTQRFDEDSAFAESAEGKALLSMIIEFKRYINEYAELEKEARTNEANAPIIARAEAAKQAMEDAAREREIIVARRQLRETQGYETYAGDDGELAYLETQISESEKYIDALKEEQANLEIGSDEYLAKANEIAEAERAHLGYLQERAECYKQMKDEADAFVKAQKAAHDEAVGQLEDEAAFAKERGIVTDEQYDRLSEQYALQADIRRKEIADKKAEMAEDMAAGKYAYGSTRWYEEYLDLMQLEGELTNLIRKEEELERARMDASTNPYENALGALGSAQSIRQSERELAESTGDFSGAIAYYSAQIKNSEDQIDLLEEINERKQDYLDYLVEEYGEAVKASDIYREIQDEINGNAESIIDAKKAMKEYTDAIERAAYVGSELDAFGQSKDQFSPEQAVASMIEAKEAIEEGFKSGYTNSKSFVAAWEAMIGDYETTFLALSDPQKKKVFEGASKYLTDGISGQIKFFKDLSKKAGSKDYFNFVDGVAVGLKEVDLAKFVEWSGFSESFVRAMAAGMAAGSPDFSISSNWEEVAEEEQTAVEVVDEFTTKVEELAGKNIGDLGMSATEAAAAGVINRLAEIAQAIINMPALNISGVTLPSATVSGGGGIKIGGASAARGSIHSRAGRTLVGELGPEIVVSGDEWRLVGKNGAEFTNLKQGDIVFNHLESQEILKKRSSKGIGGQARASINGSGRRSMNRIKNITKEEQLAYEAGLKKALKELVGGTFSTFSGGKGSGKGSGSGSSSNDTKLDWVDWIEVRLKRLADITQKWVDAAARAIGYQIQNAQLENAILAKQDEITNNQAGYERYMKQADSVGLSSDLKTRVQDGTIDINQYDDTTRNLINEYQTWYEKALDCKKAVDELKDAQKELAEEKLENILTHYDNRIDRVDSATDRQEAVIERKIAQGKEVLASDYEALLEENERRAQLLTDQYNALNAEFTSLVDRGLIEEGSDAWFEYRQELAKIDEELIQADIDAQGYIDDMNDLALASLEYAQDMLKHTQGTIEQMMDLHEAQKEALTFKEYSSLIENGMQQIENLGKQIDHFKKLQEGLEVGSDKYREYQQEIENLEADILDIKISQEEWNDALLDLKITELEKARDEYEKQNETLEKQLELEEAIAELNRAKTQRNKLIYREDGTGYRYEADAKAVRDAQKELDELMHDQLMDKIDEAIDAIEDLKGDENLYDYNAELIPYDGSLELHLSQSMADEILNGLQNTGVLDVLKQGVASGLSGKTSSVSIAIGDVIVQEAGDADALAEEIVNTLPLSIIQKVNAK